jgi:PTS system cellobiose-specific IIB component
VCYLCSTKTPEVVAILLNRTEVSKRQIGEDKLLSVLVFAPCNYTWEGVSKKIMLQVLIVCSWGMSTSLLVESMREAAQARDYDLSVEALGAGEYMARIEECDLVLIAPQIRHLRKGIEKLATSLNKPVACIEPFHYATMNGQAVLEQVIGMISPPIE